MFFLKWKLELIVSYAQTIDYVISCFHNEWDTKFYSKFYKPCSNSYVYIHKILCVLSF